MNTITAYQYSRVRMDEMLREAGALRLGRRNLKATVEQVLLGLGLVNTQTWRAQ